MDESQSCLHLLSSIISPNEIGPCKRNISRELHRNVHRMRQQSVWRPQVYMYLINWIKERRARLNRGQHENNETERNLIVKVVLSRQLWRFYMPNTQISICPPVKWNSLAESVSDASLVRSFPYDDSWIRTSANLEEGLDIHLSIV